MVQIGSVTAEILPPKSLCGGWWLSGVQTYSSVQIKSCFFHWWISQITPSIYKYGKLQSKTNLGNFFVRHLTHTFFLIFLHVLLWHTPGLRAHSCAKMLAKLLWAHFSPSVFFCYSIYLKTYNSWIENNFWWIKALKNMKKWLKNAQKCLKMAKIHARRKKTVIINPQFRV